MENNEEEYIFLDGKKKVLLDPEAHHKGGTPIQKDDLLNLHITLESTYDVLEFLKSYGYTPAN